MWDGFLGTRASFMLDAVFLAMFAVLPALCWSVWLVKQRQNYELHKRVQVGLGLILLAAVILFEGDIQLAKLIDGARDWRERAAASAYWNNGSASGPVLLSLWVHLAFAVTTTLLWIYVIVQALRNFPSPVRPSAYSPRHVRLARLAAIDMCLTAFSGWAFYWLAFVA